MSFASLSKSNETETSVEISLLATQAASARLLVTSVGSEAPANAAFNASIFTAEVSAGETTTITVTKQESGTLARLWVHFLGDDIQATDYIDVYFHKKGFLVTRINSLGDPQRIINIDPPLTDQRIRENEILVEVGDWLRLESLVVREDLTLEWQTTTDSISGEYSLRVIDVTNGTLGAINRYLTPEYSAGNGTVSGVFHASFTGNVPHTRPLSYTLITPSKEVITGVVYPSKKGAFSISHAQITSGKNMLVVELASGDLRAKTYWVQ